MSTAIEKRNGGEGSHWDSREMVETLKQTVCRGATDAQFRMFAEVCKATGLNPFLKEIWFVPSVGVMAGRDGYLRVANEHPMFDGMETRVERDDKNVPIKATCSVWRKDRAHPIVCEAYYSEYKKGGNVWNIYPSAMISKVAEVLALKRSFSINGIVTEEEIGGDGPPKETPAEVAERQIAANNQKRLTQGLEPITEGNPVTDIEVRDAITHGTTVTNYEQRERKRIEELNEILEVKPCANPDCPIGCPDSHAISYHQESPPKARKRGSISFKALGEIKVLKDELRKLMGTDGRYYAQLAELGVDHADELDQKQGRELWKSLAAIRSKFAQDAELKKVLEESWLKLGDTQFIAILGSNGCVDVGEAMQLGGTGLTGLLEDLKLAVDILTAQRESNEKSN